MKSLRAWVLGIFLILLLVAFWRLQSRPSSNPSTQVACTMDAKLCPDGSSVGRVGPNCEFARCPDGITPTPIANVIYRCEGGKTIHAIYTNEQVAVDLSDGRSLTLPQTMSGSGARYANSDESVVFWNKGNTAFVEEGNNTTYANCNQE